MRKRRAVALGVAAAVATAFLAHFIYWYRPRERTARPSERACEALASRGWELVAWLPYPHQNLGALEGRIGDLRRWLRLVTAERGAAARHLPSFGPWPLPPAREMVVAVSGDTVAIDLAVYPSVAWLARASGWLAGNRWLRGGEVSLGGGRRARVAWRDGRWTLRVGQERPWTSVDGPETVGVALAWVRLDRGVGQLPPGLYRLERSASSLELVAGQPPKAATPPLEGGEPPAAAWIVQRFGRRTLRGLVLWQEEGAMPPFPAALALERGRIERQRLPGEELLRVAGGEPVSGRVADVSLRALTHREIERGAPVAAAVDATFGARVRLRLWAGVRPRLLTAAAQRTAARLEGMPLGRLMDVEPERLAHLLAPVEACEASVLEVWERPFGARWRVCLGESGAAVSR